VSTVLWAVGAAVAVLVAWGVYLSIVLAWGDQRTQGVAYYGLGPEERARFKRRLRLHALLLIPPLRVLARFSGFTFDGASFRFQGISGPKGTCTEESFAAGHAYEPGPEDVFVVTQMKCGTTWMQHVVYQVLARGAGDLVESGRTLYAVSPWLESVKSVAVAEAPTVGTERPGRVIKTHFPASLCPFSAEARYVYVARHPVSCFASCADFVAANLGPFRPGLDAIEAWFCSDDAMWWGSWPAHVDGWWALARERENVLFVRFEEMKADLPAVVGRVADFLGVRPLDEAELAAVVETCGFEYMKRHEDAFEMHPPHLLALDADLFVSGSAERHRDVPAEVRRRVGAWCVDHVRPGGFPVERYYPDAESDR